MTYISVTDAGYVLLEERGRGLSFTFLGTALCIQKRADKSPRRGGLVKDDKRVNCSFFRPAQGSRELDRACLMTSW